MGVTTARSRGGACNNESRRSNGAKRNHSENGDTECHHFLGLFLHFGAAHLVLVPLIYIYIDIEQLGGRSIRFNDHSEGNGIFRRFSSSLCHNRIEIIHRLFENFIGNLFAGFILIIIFRRVQTGEGSSPTKGDNLAEFFCVRSFSFIRKAGDIENFFFAPNFLGKRDVILGASSSRFEVGFPNGLASTGRINLFLGANTKLNRKFVNVGSGGEITS